MKDLQINDRVACLEYYSDILSHGEIKAVIQTFPAKEFSVKKILKKRYAEDLIYDRIKVLAVNLEGLIEAMDLYKSRGFIFYIFDQIFTQHTSPIFYKSSASADLVKDLEIVSMLGIESGYMHNMANMYSKKYLDTIYQSTHSQLPINAIQTQSLLYFVLVAVFISVISYLLFRLKKKKQNESYDQLKSKATEEKNFNNDMNILLKFDKILIINTSKFIQRLKDLCSIIVTFGKLADIYKVKLEKK